MDGTATTENMRAGIGFHCVAVCPGSGKPSAALLLAATGHAIARDATASAEAPCAWRGRLLLAAGVRHA